MQTKAALVGLALTFLSLVESEQQTCSRLLASDNVAESDKFKVQLCQLYTVAKVADTFVTTLREDVSGMLSEQGVTSDVSADELDVGKRKNDFLRFGKRKNDFLRFGKRKNDFLRFGKRKNDFLRFGKAAYPQSYIKGRFGKRVYQYLRDWFDAEAALN